MPDCEITVRTKSNDRTNNATKSIILPSLNKKRNISVVFKGSVPADFNDAYYSKSPNEPQTRGTANLGASPPSNKQQNTPRSALPSPSGFMDAIAQGLSPHGSRVCPHMLSVLENSLRTNSRPQCQIVRLLFGRNPKAEPTMR